MPERRTPEIDSPSKPSRGVDVEMEKVLDQEYPASPAAKEAARNGMRALDARIDAEDRLAAINQQEMVLPAPAGFQPEPVARKVRLKIILEKSRIQSGEEPRFRLELTNVGRETIDYREHQSSIFKGGSILYSLDTIRFYLTNGAGAKAKLRPALGVGRSEPFRKLASTPDSENKMTEANAAGQASTTFRVKLRPGETLRSLGDGNSTLEPFRTLRVEGGFKKPGKYVLKVELDDRPKPLNEHYIKLALSFSTLDEIKRTHARRLSEALGPVSAEAPLEVAR